MSSTPSNSPAGHAEHHRHHDIDSRELMEQERGKIPKAEVMEQFENLPPEWKKKACEILTGDPNKNPDEHNPEHWMLIYYLNTLYQADILKAAQWIESQGNAYKERLAKNLTGDPHGQVDISANSARQQQLLQAAGLLTTGRFATVFVDVYEKQLKPGEKLPDIKDIPTSQAVIDNITKTLHPPKSGQQATYLGLLQSQIGILVDVENEFKLIPPPLIQQLLTAGTHLMTFITDLEDRTQLQVQLRQFYRAIEAKKIASTSALRAPGQPMAGSQVVYLCMKKEHAGTTKADDYLERAAAEDIAHFAVGQTSVDFGGIGKATTKGLQRAKDEATRAGLMTKGFAQDLLRSSVGGVIEEFPIFAGLNASAGEHDLKHQLEKVSTREVVELIGYLRYEATKKRTESRFHIGGVRVTGLDELQQFVRVMEDIVAERLKEDILKGDAKDAWKRTSGVLRENLFVPLQHVAHNDPKATKEHLKHIKAPEHAHPKEHHGVLGAVLEMRKKYGTLGLFSHIAELVGFYQHAAKGKDSGGSSHPPDHPN